MDTVPGGAETVVSTADALRALSHPKRLQLLAHLQKEKEGTATSCGKAVGLSSSACSYHLRLLAQHGYIEPASNDHDKRTTVWRIKGESLKIRPRGDDAQQAAVPISRMLLDEAYRISRTSIEARDTIPGTWRDRSGYSYWRIEMTSQELSDLRESVDQLIWKHAKKQGKRRGSRTVFFMAGGVVNLPTDHGA